MNHTPSTGEPEMESTVKRRGRKPFTNNPHVVAITIDDETLAFVDKFAQPRATAVREIIKRYQRLIAFTQIQLPLDKFERSEVKRVFDLNPTSDPTVLWARCLDAGQAELAGKVRNLNRVQEEALHLLVST